jgi:hypothetical protein
MKKKRFLRGRKLDTALYKTTNIYSQGFELQYLFPKYEIIFEDLSLYRIG